VKRRLFENAHNGSSKEDSQNKIKRNKKRQNETKKDKKKNPPGSVSQKDGAIEKKESERDSYRERDGARNDHPFPERSNNMEVRPKSKDPNGEVVEGNEEDYQMESVIEEGDEVDKDEERDRKGQSTEQDRVGEEDSKGKKCDTSATKKDLESSKFTSVFPEQVSSGDVPVKYGTRRSNMKLICISFFRRSNCRRQKENQEHERGARSSEAS